MQCTTTECELNIMTAKQTRRFTIGILVLSFFLSLTTDKIEVIIRLTSSLVGSVVGFILPAIALLCLGVSSRPRCYSHHGIACLLAIFGSTLILFEFFVSSPSSSQSNLVGLLAQPRDQLKSVQTNQDSKFGIGQLAAPLNQANLGAELNSNNLDRIPRTGSVQSNKSDHEADDRQKQPIAPADAPKDRIQRSGLDKPQSIENNHSFLMKQKSLDTELLDPF